MRFKARAAGRWAKKGRKGLMRGLGETERSVPSGEVPYFTQEVLVKGFKVTNRGCPTSAEYVDASRVHRIHQSHDALEPPHADTQCGRVGAHVSREMVDLLRAETSQLQKYKGLEMLTKARIGAYKRNVWVRTWAQRITFQLVSNAVQLKI